jgi:hypothetical protein
MIRRKITRDVVVRMRQTRNLAVIAAGVFLAGWLAFVPARSQTFASNPGQSDDMNPSQAVVTYGFLRYDYLSFDQVIASNPNLAATKKLKSLDAALGSLDCDLRTRMAGPHKLLALPSFPVGRWVGFPGSSKNSIGSWLFVVETPDARQHKTLVLFSNEAPGQTTVFWLEKSSGGYAAKLVFDSFKKGKVRNEWTTVGAATSIKFLDENHLLLKDHGEPGVGPPEFRRINRVFRLDLSQASVTLVSPGIPSQ